MIQVILNADDFGRSKERNRAIDDAFKQGLICSAGLIVTGKDLQDAVDYINKGGYADKVHLHVNLSTSMRDGDSEDIPLTKAMRKDSFFCTNGKFTPYKGLPHKFLDIRKWRIAYHEIVAQYKRFIEVTDGKADYKHIDFHLWYNLTWPVSVALNLFTRKYKIKYVRYIGIHQMNNKRKRLLCKLSWNPQVKSYPATNIDYFISKYQSFKDNQIIELYCHPNYKEDGTFLDDSPSYIKHERRPMLNQIQDLREIENIKFISWEDNV